MVSVVIGRSALIADRMRAFTGNILNADMFVVIMYTTIKMA
jgi:hypothetical protein